MRTALSLRLPGLRLKPLHAFLLSVPAALASFLSGKAELCQNRASDNLQTEKRLQNFNIVYLVPLNMIIVLFFLSLSETTRSVWELGCVVVLSLISGAVLTLIENRPSMYRCLVC